MKRMILMSCGLAGLIGGLSPGLAQPPRQSHTQNQSPTRSRVDQTPANSIPQNQPRPVQPPVPEPRQGVTATQQTQAASNTQSSVNQAGPTQAQPRTSQQSQQQQRTATVVPRPQWQVGDRWVVETATRPLQSRTEATGQSSRVKVRWQFTITGTEAIGGREAFRISISCLDARVAQPNTTIWIDRQSGALRQVQTQLPIPGGFRTLTESYTGGEQPVPVFGPLTALPVDLPAFVPPGTKDAGTYQYEAVAGPAGVKAVGETSFSFTVRQSSEKARLEKVRDLLPDRFTKDLTVRPTVDVHLQASDRRVRQIWQQDQPWPAFSSNGSTEARLIGFERAAQKPE